MLNRIIKEEYTRHGGAFDRGSADSYYGRPRNPHYFKGASYDSEPTTELSEEEVCAYDAGYDYNEEYGDKKQW
jgi:hypothetical protein